MIDNEPIYIRVLGTKPALFRTPENAGFLDAFYDNFSLRGDEPYVSLWLHNHSLCTDVPAAFTAFARNKHEKISYVLIPQSLFEQAGIEVFMDPSGDRAFECIREAHYGFKYDLVKLKKLGKLVQKILCDPSSSADTQAEYCDINRTALREQLKALDLQCRDADGQQQYQDGLVKGWALAFR